MSSVPPLTPVSLPPTGFLEPTWQGFVFSTRDALLIFEACLRRDLHPVPRRPHDRERANLIQSGSVFVYMETDSGIKRWTDGVPWSPSRILGNFLIYRELEKAFGPGEKKRALKHGNKRTNRPGEPYPRREESEEALINSPRSPQVAENPVNDYPLDRNNIRALIGSLTDSYAFRDKGLIKKTITVKFDNINYHLVSYYTISDVQSYQLKTPTESGRGFSTPRRELWEGQNFRSNDNDNYEPMSVPYQNFHSPYVPSSYAYRSPPSYPQQALPLPSLPPHCQSYSTQIYRTSTHEQENASEHSFPTLPSSSQATNSYHRGLELPPNMGIKNEHQNFGMAAYAGSDTMQREGEVNYHNSSEHGEHSVRIQEMQFPQTRLPSLPAQVPRGFGEPLPKPELVEYARPDFSSQGWHQPSQPDPNNYQEDRTWVANSNEYASELYRDQGQDSPWHPPQR